MKVDIIHFPSLYYSALGPDVLLSPLFSGTLDLFYRQGNGPSFRPLPTLFNFELD
jgi:hypothetical protein